MKHTAGDTVSCHFVLSFHGLLDQEFDPLIFDTGPPCRPRGRVWQVALGGSLGTAGGGSGEGRLGARRRDRPAAVRRKSCSAAGAGGGP